MLKKIKCTIHITIDMILGKMIKNFVVLLLLIAVFVLIGASLIVLNFKDYDEMELSKLCNIEKTGYIYFDGEADREDENEFYESVMQSQYVNYVGDFMNSYLNEDKPIIADMQAGHQYCSYYAGIDAIETTCIDKETLQIFDLDIEYNDDVPSSGLILGYRYKKKFKNQSKIKCDGIEFDILGFTSKNTKWLSDEVGGNTIPDVTGLVDTGYMCFYIKDNDNRMTDSSWFQLSDAKDFKLFKEEVERLAKKHNVPAVVCPLRDYIQLEEERNSKIFIELIDYANKAMTAIVLFMIIIKVYSFWANKRQYGIMYSSGMTSRRITATIFIENIIIFYIALMIAWIILWNGFGAIKQVYLGPYGAIERVIQDILLNRVFLQEFIVSTLCCGLTAAIPACIFNCIAPINMIKDFYE